MKKIANLANALHSLAPLSQWVYEDEDYSTIQWLSEDVEQPSEEAVKAEIIRMQQELDDEAAAEEAKKLAAKAARESALAKLAILGLTEEEAKAVIGID